MGALKTYGLVQIRPDDDNEIAANQGIVLYMSTEERKNTFLG